MESSLQMQVTATSLHSILERKIPYGVVANTRLLKRENSQIFVLITVPKHRRQYNQRDWGKHVTPATFLL